MDSDQLAPRAAQSRDVAALIGMLAVLEGEVRAADAGDEVPGWALPLARRLSGDGLLPLDADPRELRQALNDLNQRLRYVLGEYDEPPTPTPVP